MKCIIISMFSKSEVPYVDYYLNELDVAGIAYDIAYFERYSKREAGDNELLFQEYCPTGGSKVKKLGTMLRYCRFIRKHLSSRAYDRAIILTTVPALMCFDLLLNRYRGRFILDIRDYTHESNSIYRSVLGRIIDASYRTVLSSRGFLRFLPGGDKYVFTHNVTVGSESVERAEYFISKPIKIGFVGSVRYFDENSAFISKLGNSSDYQLEYHGTQTLGCNLKEWCEQQGYSNVVFTGRFDNAGKARICRGIDFINSIYGTAGLETTTAIPNRLYDAALYKCPIISSKNTYLSEIVEKYGLGISVDVFKDDLIKTISDYIISFDRVRFEAGCTALLSDVQKDMGEFLTVVKDFAQTGMTA